MMKKFLKLKMKFCPALRKRSLVPLGMRGFTIIEVVVAIAVFGIGVLGLVGFFALSSQTVRYASNTSIATNLASGLLDEKFSLSYDELTPETGAKEAYTNDSSPYNKFKKQVDVNLINSDLNASGSDLGLKKIDVYVYWQEGSSEKNVHLSTIKSNR